MYHRRTGDPRGFESFFFPSFYFVLALLELYILEMHHDACWCQEGTLHHVREYVN